MQKVLKKPFFSSLILGFIIVIPFVATEFINKNGLIANFPYEVFIFIWILQTLFIMLLMPIIKTKVAGKSLTKNSPLLLLRILGLCLIAYIWAGWIIDQWPCFMGVPNCD